MLKIEWKTMANTFIKEELEGGKRKR